MSLSTRQAKQRYLLREMHRAFDNFAWTFGQLAHEYVAEMLSSHRAHNGEVRHET